MGDDVINYSEGYNSGLEKQTSHFLSFMNNSFKSKTNFFPWNTTGGQEIT